MVDQQRHRRGHHWNGLHHNTTVRLDYLSHLIQLVKASAMRTRPPILETPLKSGF
jgi:hypothetical protein